MVVRTRRKQSASTTQLLFVLVPHPKMPAVGKGHWLIVHGGPRRHSPGSLLEVMADIDFMGLLWRCYLTLFTLLCASLTGETLFWPRLKHLSWVSPADFCWGFVNFIWRCYPCLLSGYCDCSVYDILLTICFFHQVLVISSFTSACYKTQPCRVSGFRRHGG